MADLATTALNLYKYHGNDLSDACTLRDSNTMASLGAIYIPFHSQGLELAEKWESDLGEYWLFQRIGGQSCLMPGTHVSWEPAASDR